MFNKAFLSKKLISSSIKALVLTSSLALSSPLFAALISDGTYYIKNINSNKYLDVTNGYDACGTNVQQWSGNGADCQKWVVTNIDDNYVYIRTAMSSNRSLDVENGSTADGTNVRLWDFNGSDAQIFKIKKVASGEYALLPKSSGGNSAIDVYGWSTEDGGNVNQWSYNGLDCQLWKFEKTSASNNSSSNSSSNNSSSSNSSSANNSSSNNGTTKTITSTIVVKAGETYDGKGVTIVAKGMGDGGQGEGQSPIFELEKGATLKNVVIAAPGCDGIHCYGDNTIENVTWEDVGEDALTVKGGSSNNAGTIRITNCTAKHAYDKLFQCNAPCTVYFTNVTAYDIGKFVRQNGKTDFKCTWYIDSCNISKVKDSIGRTDSKNTKIYYRNLTVSDCPTWWKTPNSSQVSTY